METTTLLDQQPLPPTAAFNEDVVRPCSWQCGSVPCRIPRLLCYRLRHLAPRARARIESPEVPQFGVGNRAEMGEYSGLGLKRRYYLCRAPAKHIPVVRMVALRSAAMFDPT